MALLHTHMNGDGAHWAKEIFLDGFLDTLAIIPFLFLTYLLMEFIEHKAGDKAEKVMQRAGIFAPVIGGILGTVPQCGFSAAASNLYAGRIISIGTVVAIFLSTSDEMIPILISGNVTAGAIALVVLYKAVVGIVVGLLVDAAIRLVKPEKEKINIDAICDEDNCHCEKGILHSAIHHTITISVFVFVITLAINALVYLIGEENLGRIMYDKPVISHIIASIFGLIPNCAASLALTSLCTNGLITVGTMMSGLFSGAGVGLLVLFKVNKKTKENFLVMGVIILCGIVFGILGDLIFPKELFII